MGGSLTVPITSKAITRTGTPYLRISACEMQGYRVTMEDSKSIILDFSTACSPSVNPSSPDSTPSESTVSNSASSNPLPANNASSPSAPVASGVLLSELQPVILSPIGNAKVAQQPSPPAFLGIFDGHCCEHASQWFAAHLPQKILQQPDFSPGKIKNACLEADLGYRAHVRQHGEKPGGTTAVFAIIIESTHPINPLKPFKVIVGNIGDSRCLLIRDGINLQQVTEDHKPSNPDEKKRILAAGGTVRGGRVDEMLAVSRALGDTFLKVNSALPAEQQKVCAVPDIFELEGIGGDDVILLMCDGVVEHSSNKQVFGLLKSYMEQTPQDPALALSKLLSAQLISSTDNMTAIMLEFKDGSGYGQEGELEYVPMNFQERSVYRMSEDKYEALQHGFEHFGARYGYPTGYKVTQSNLESGKAGN